MKNRLGNEYDEKGKLVVMSSARVDDKHFWCVVCRSVKPIKIGCIASVSIGGWMCSSHRVPRPVPPMPEPGF